MFKFFYFYHSPEILVCLNMQIWLMAECLSTISPTIGCNDLEIEFVRSVCRCDRVQQRHILRVAMPWHQLQRFAAKACFANGFCKSQVGIGTYWSQQLEYCGHQTQQRHIEDSAGSIFAQLIENRSCQWTKRQGQLKPEKWWPTRINWIALCIYSDKFCQE